MPTTPFVPESFRVPELLMTDRVVLRPLTIHDLDADYDAVMSSIDHLRQSKPFGPGHDWPDTALSRDQDLVDLGWHQKEFQKRSSFAYTVMSQDNQVCLGCVYLYPSTREPHDAMVILWVRESKVAEGLDEHLLRAVQDWVGGDWPFSNPGYPGRTSSWEQWEQLPAR